MTRLATVALCTFVLSVAGAQAAGQELAGLVPRTLAGKSRADLTPYSRFVTASYTLDGGHLATLQIHDVVGAGAAAHQERTCTRWQPVRGERACVAQRSSGTSVIWVFSDTMQVMVGAPDEATALALAADLDLAPIRRLARTLAR